MYGDEEMSVVKLAGMGYCSGNEDDILMGPGSEDSN